MIEQNICPRCFGRNIKTFDYFGEYQTVCCTCFDVSPGHNKTIQEAETAWNNTWQKRFDSYDIFRKFHAKYDKN